jgi:hypothetical protein
MIAFTLPKVKYPSFSDSFITVSYSRIIVVLLDLSSHLLELLPQLKIRPNAEHCSSYLHFSPNLAIKINYISKILNLIRIKV